MAKISNALFKGGSGEQYRFEVYTLDTVFRSGVGGIYVFARRYKLGEGFTLDPIYINIKDDFSTLVGYHPKQTCIEQQGGNCKCIYTTDDDDRKEYIMADLLDFYQPPCQ